MKSIVFIFVFSFSKNVFDSLEVPLQCSGNFCFPRVIWSHWGDDSLPEDVEEMVTMSRKSLVNFTYCLLTPKNVSDFLDQSLFPRVLGAITKNFQADYIRVCLLEKYGGVYVDSTMFITSGVAMEHIFDKALNEKRPLFGFEKSLVGTPLLIESAFMGAPKGSQFMAKYREEFETVLNGDPKPYLSESCAFLTPMFDGPTLNRLFSLWTECTNVYFMIDHVFLSVYLKHSQATDVLVLPWEEGPFRLVIECRTNVPCLVNRLKKDPVARAMPFIKVPRGYRKGTRLFGTKTGVKLDRV